MNAALETLPVEHPSPRRVPMVSASKPVFVPPFADLGAVEPMPLDVVRQRTKSFLHETLPQCLKRVGTTHDNIDLTVEDKELIEVCGTRYAMNWADGFAKFWIGVNVKRLIFILFIRRTI
jgi:hypothetical protein